MKNVFKCFVFKLFYDRLSKKLVPYSMFPSSPDIGSKDIYSTGSFYLPLFLKKKFIFSFPILSPRTSKREAISLSFIGDIITFFEVSVDSVVDPIKLV